MSLWNRRNKERDWAAGWKGPAPGHGPPYMPGGRREPVGLLGLHGDAGVTILAAQLTDVIDLRNLHNRGGLWPDPNRGDPRLVVAVTRTHGKGFAALRQALYDYAFDRTPHGMYLAGALLVADGPDKLPPELSGEITKLQAVTAIERVGWIPGWRAWLPPEAGRTPASPAASGKAAEVVQKVQRFLDKARSTAMQETDQPAAQRAAQPVAHSSAHTSSGSGARAGAQSRAVPQQLPQQLPQLPPPLPPAGPAGRGAPAPPNQTHHTHQGPPRSGQPNGQPSGRPNGQGAAR